MIAEVYVGLYLGDCQVWDIEEVEIPDETPEEKVEEAALAAWRDEYGCSDRVVAFYGLLGVREKEEDDGVDCAG